MNKFIVSTTINQPTEATLKFADLAVKNNWIFVMVGDLKTPHQSYRDLENKYPENFIYLTPEDQERLCLSLSDAIGWKSIQRRNMGFLYAYQNGADVLATVDDDNIPYSDWGTDLVVGEEVEIDLWEAKNGFFDPLSATNTPELWHRGYPIEHLRTKNNIDFKGKGKRKVLVQADLWDGDPDIDAICRLANLPCVKYDTKCLFGSNQISPFNSQNTFVAREVIPHYMVIPHLGRMDDIWGSYLIQKKFPHSVAYNRASVYQDRNPQDLVKNLENEIIGYRNTLPFIKGEYELPEKAQEAYNIYQQSFNQV